MLKDQLRKLNKCQISERGYQQGPSDETLKKVRCQFCDVKFGHRIMEAVGFFDYKCTILSKLPLISQTDEARVLFHDFLISFYMGDIFIGNILLNKL